MIHVLLIFFYDVKHLGILDVKLLKPETEEYHRFEDEVRRRTQDPPFNYTIPEDEDVSRESKANSRNIFNVYKGLSPQVR